MKGPVNIDFKAEASEERGFLQVTIVFKQTEAVETVSFKLATLGAQAWAELLLEQVKKARK